MEHTNNRERVATAAGQVNGNGKAALEEPGADSQNVTDIPLS